MRFRTEKWDAWVVEVEVEVVEQLLHRTVVSPPPHKGVTFVMFEPANECLVAQYVGGIASSSNPTPHGQRSWTSSVSVMGGPHGQRSWTSSVSVMGGLCRPALASI